MEKIIQGTGISDKDTVVLVLLTDYASAVEVLGTQISLYIARNHSGSARASSMAKASDPRLAFTARRTRWLRQEFILKSAALPFKISVL